MSSDSSVKGDQASVKVKEYSKGENLKAKILPSNPSSSVPGANFSDPKVADYWREVYENSKYEGRHRFDPDFQWDVAEEKALVRKIDIRIMLFVWVMFMALDLIRRNINRVLPDNFLEDLNMTQNDFNNGQVIFFVSFLFMELPSGLISKKIGADVWVPTQIVTWSVLCSAQFGLKNRTGQFLLRSLIGLSQGKKYNIKRCSFLKLFRRFHSRYVSVFVLLLHSVRAEYTS